MNEEPESQPDWVAKVHPLARPAEAEDPYELVAQPVAGDPDVMLECILQEYAWMGWTGEQLLSLFRNPGYPVLVELHRHFGEEAIRARVAALAAQWGTLRFRETLVEPEDEESAMELVQLKLPPQLNR